MLPLPFPGRQGAESLFAERHLLLTTDLCWSQTRNQTGLVPLKGPQKELKSCAQHTDAHDCGPEDS